MVKSSLILLCVLLLTGCATKLKTEVQEVLIPLTYCPAPVEVERPVLPIEQMTPEQKQIDGEVAKHAKATIKALLDYSEALEKVVDHYGDINKLSDDIRKQIEDKKKEVEKTTSPQ